MKIDLATFLQQNSVEGFIDILTCKRASDEYSLPYKEVEQVALQNAITPLRYKRNQSLISIENQARLLDAHVAIIGCGGLGGHIAEILTRIGVGELSVYDFDVFEEHNLNRQNFSHYGVIGKQKAVVLKEECEKINPALHVNDFVKKFDVEEDFATIENADVIIDALDDPALKLQLAFTCKQNSIDFVHGAIAGCNAQHSTCNTLENLYRDDEKGIETQVGNPAFTVTYAASIQSSECIKLLLGLGETLKDKLLISNLLENEFILLDN